MASLTEFRINKEIEIENSMFEEGTTYLDMQRIKTAAILETLKEAKRRRIENGK